MNREEAERNAAPLMDGYRQQFERGDSIGVIDAVRFAIMWGLPIPPWASETADAAIVHYFKSNGGARTRGKAGGLKVQWQRDKMHRKRHQLVEREIARGLSKAAACRRVSELLKGHRYRGTPRAIGDSFKKVRAALGRRLIEGQLAVL